MSFKMNLFGLPTTDEMMSAIKENVSNIKDAETRSFDGFAGKQEHLFWAPVKDGTNQVAYTPEDAKKIKPVPMVITVDPATGTLHKRTQKEWGEKMVGVVKPQEAMGTQTKVELPAGKALPKKDGVGSVKPQAAMGTQTKSQMTEKQVQPTGAGKVGSVKPESTFKSKIPTQLRGTMHDFTQAVTKIVKSA
jgi:hypothetical protein